MEALAAAAAGAVGDANASLVVVCTETGVASNAVSKYRPGVPQVQHCTTALMPDNLESHIGRTLQMFLVYKHGID
jgi:pyruvate kinase